jgi:ribosomal protein S18 acetylase RimI-like enzyme
MEFALADGYLATSLRVGDVSWLSREHTHRELALDIQLWENGSGQVVAWTYFRANGEFNAFVAPNAASAADAPLFDELLSAIDEAAAAADAAGDPAATLVTYAIDPARSPEDRALAAALVRFGYQVDPEATAASGVLTRSLVDSLPTVSVPAGYRLGWVDSSAAIVGRVDAHRAAFAPSDLSVRKYERLRRTWAYRAPLDRIALTDQGEVVAFCTAWLDEQNGSGLFEPVGTRPMHQRRGLARAVCADALGALQAAGARTAQVAFGTEAARATYESLGFHKTNEELVFKRPAT